VREYGCVGVVAARHRGKPRSAVCGLGGPVDAVPGFRGPIVDDDACLRCVASVSRMSTQTLAGHPVRLLDLPRRLRLRLRALA
jgi:hypothetical protein